MVNISEASSSCSPSIDKKYDVFLSFRGEDTRLSFTGHLHKALKDANLKTFFDDEEINTGLFLKPELESAIRASRASVIVLSKNYATSRWCLNELALILEQHKDFDHIVIPIFYHVEPNVVRKQQNSFGDAMEDYKKKMEEETNAEKKCEWAQKIEIWKNALTLVADLKGKDATGRVETVLIEEIVKEIYHRLGVPLDTTLPLLIGMDYNIKFITSWLKDGSSHTADILTILGMGGIGKTSLAKYVYGLYCREFSRSSIVENISRRCGENFNGLLDLQKQLCGDILKTSLIQGQDVISVIENALANKKVFLVLDDIDSFVQLDALLGKRGLFPGSKIIITTKDKSLTHLYSPLNPSIQPKHTKHFLVGLDKSASLKLLSFHAFGCSATKKGYEEVSDDIVKYSEGHPLALEVLGRSLYNQDVAYWEDYLDRLKKEPDSHIEKVLEMSFHSLPDNDKELFKYIACFFVGEDRDFTEILLKACGINTRSGITNLIQRCLVSIWNNQLEMHSLIQYMGRDLVRQESPRKPGMRSRLWDHEESFNVLKLRKGTEDILGLYLDMRMLKNQTLRGSFELQTDTLSNLDNLKLLQVNYVHINGSYENFPEELRWLCMHGFPLECIPSDLRMENLVALDLSYSNIISFDMPDSSLQPPAKRQKRLIGSCSKDKRSLGSLKILDLSFCEQLLCLGGFSEFPALERLIVTNCIRLVEVCESVEQCAELSIIDLSYCYNLEKLPTSLGKLKKVKTLLLDGCGLHERPAEMKGMDSQEMVRATNSQEFSCEAIPSKLKFLAFLPSSLVRLSLKNNNLSNESFPTDFSCLSVLKQLKLNGNPIISMPTCVRSLPRLEELSMSYCKMLVSVVHPPRTLKEMDIEESSFYYKPRYGSSLRKIVLDPEMSTLKLEVVFELYKPWSIEIDGMFKTQSMSGAVNILCNLGWNNSYDTSVRRRGRQVYYEFGIFSTLYGGEAMPNWIRDRNKGPVISFTIPLSPKKLRGLNFCNVQKNSEFFKVPSITISNVTKNITWIYNHLILGAQIENKYIIFLCHWMFGSNEMEAGDQVSITVTQRTQDDNQLTEECGISLVYDDDDYDDYDDDDDCDDDDNADGDEEEDALSYYKSWNHIIGKDLSAFQLATGEYILQNKRLSWDYLSYYNKIVYKVPDAKDSIR